MTDQAHIKPPLAEKMIDEGTIIESFWHLDRSNNKHSVDYKGSYYTVFRDRHGYPHSFKKGVLRSPELEEYKNRNK